MNEKAVTLRVEAPPARTQPPTVVDMMEQMIQKGVTAENVAALGELVKLHERMEERNAQKAFTAAFRELQESLPTIVAQTVIPNRGKYERFEDIMDKIGPLLRKHGFTVSFSQPPPEAGRVTEICHLRHVGGHSESNSFSVRTSAKADSETQADCKAATTAKRNALLNALNIIIRQDVAQSEDDESLIGAPITAEQADHLRKLIVATGTFESSFLKFANAKSIEAIGSAQFAELDAELQKALAKKSAKK